MLGRLGRDPAPLGDRGPPHDGALRGRPAAGRHRRGRRASSTSAARPSTDRPIVAQSARNRFTGIVTRIEARPRRGRRRGHRRPASAGQPDDRRGRRGARPQGRRRGGLRRQGDQRHRRDPVREGAPSVKPSAPRVAGRRRPRGLLVAACSGGGAAPRPPRPAAAPSRGSPPAAAGRADDLRRRLAEGRPRQGQDRVRGGQPGHDADDLDRLVVRARDADRAGRAGRRLPVGRHDEPAEARRRRASPTATPVAFAGNKLTVIVADRQPGRRSTPGGPREAGRQGHRRGRRGADHEVRDAARRQPGQGARLPGGLRRRLQRERRVQGGQRQGRRRQDRARRGRRRDRLRHRRQGVRQGRDGRRPRLGQRPGDVRRRRRQGVAEPGRRHRRSSTGSPGPTARRSWRRSGSCRRRS